MKKSLFLSLICLSMAACGSGTPDTSHTNLTPIKHDQPAACKTMTVSGNHTLEYCVQAPTQTTSSSNVLYYFHGIYGSAEEIVSSNWAPFYTQLNQQLGDQTPTVVGLSFGKTTLIVPNSRDQFAPTPAMLQNEVFPAIEKQLFGTSSVKRYAMGASMGGFNALNVAASTASQIRALAALCPAVVDFDVFSDADVGKFMARNGSLLDRQSVEMAVRIARQTFGSEANWQADSPMQNLRTGKYDALPMYLSTGRQDQFGFFEGATAFDMVAIQRKLTLTFVPVDGKHCSYDSAMLVTFLKAQIGQ